MRFVQREHVPAAYVSVAKLCDILAAPRETLDTQLVRGAVFFLGMTVWGSQRAESLHVTPSAVLPYVRTVIAAQVLRHTHTDTRRHTIFNVANCL